MKIYIFNKNRLICLGIKYMYLIMFYWKLVDRFKWKIWFEKNMLLLNWKEKLRVLMLFKLMLIINIFCFKYKMS